MLAAMISISTDDSSPHCKHGDVVDAHAMR